MGESNAGLTVGDVLAELGKRIKALEDEGLTALRQSGIDAAQKELMARVEGWCVGMEQKTSAAIQDAIKAAEGAAESLTKAAADALEARIQALEAKIGMLPAPTSESTGPIGTK